MKIAIKTIPIDRGPRGVPRRPLSLTLPGPEYDALAAHAHERSVPVAVLVRSILLETGALTAEQAG